MTTPLITYAELRRYPLPVKENQWDAMGQSHVETIIEYASQAIMDYVDLGIASAYYTDTVSGMGRSSVVLDQYPVQSLHSVTSYNQAGTSLSLMLGDFAVDSSAGIIYFRDRSRNAFYHNYGYEIHYRAGWDIIPGPIKHAVALQAVQMLQPMFRGGQNFTETKLIDGINEEIVDLVEKYKRKRIG
jgi:uncharacterized phiE125 gp8 family phage protein